MKEITINTEKIESIVLYKKGLFKKKYVIHITMDSKDEHTNVYADKALAEKDYEKLKDAFNKYANFLTE